jgi:thioredoxin reductase
MFMTQKSIQTDLAIIGAGPAGLAAADVAHSCGINTVIIDEQASAGGQIYRQPPAQYKVSSWLSSRIYKQGKQLLHKVSELEDILWLKQTTVLGLFKSDDTAAEYNHKLIVNNRDGTHEVIAKTVLIATGCYDMPVIFPGWNLPGVMASGGIQAFVKSQQIIPGKRFLFIGSHPLQLIVADQIVQAGGEVAGVIFAQKLSSIFSLLKSPFLLLRFADKFLYILSTLIRLKIAGVPVSFGKTILAADGKDKLDSVSIVPLTTKDTVDKNSSTKIECDRLGLCFSFLTSSELARQAGAEYSWSADGGGWVITHDELMRTNIHGIYVAGETTGVAGAEVAMVEGKIAGLGVALELGKVPESQASKALTELHRRLKSLNQFANLLKRLSFPATGLLEQIMTRDSTLCKCEEITVGDFLDKLDEIPYTINANSAKLLTRAGMGICQGRYCNYYTRLILAKHYSENDFKPFTARFPSKPVTISELIE